MPLGERGGYVPPAVTLSEQSPNPIKSQVTDEPSSANRDTKSSSNPFEDLEPNTNQTTSQATNPFDELAPPKDSTNPFDHPESQSNSATILTTSTNPFDHPESNESENLLDRPEPKNNSTTVPKNLNPFGEPEPTKIVRKSLNPFEEAEMDTVNNNNQHQATVRNSWRRGGERRATVYIAPNTQKQVAKKKKFAPFRPLTNLRYPFVVMMAICGGLGFGTMFTYETLIPIFFSEVYHLNELEVGLTYLGGGVGNVASSIIGGKLLDCICCCLCMFCC